MLILFHNNPTSEFNNLEIFSYSFSFGAAYLAILGFILDWTVGVTLINVLIPTITIILMALITRRKYILEQCKFKYIFKFKNKSFILILLVLSFGLVIRVTVPVVNEILMAWDPWYWLDLSKNIVYHGHSLISFKPLYPSGYAYIAGISCLINLELTYLYIQLISVSVYFIVGATTVICLAYRILDENKVYSLFAGLIFSTAYFLASYGMLGLPQNVAFAILPTALFLTARKGLKRLPGIFLISGIYIIHSPTAMIILITLSVYGLYYLLTNRQAIYYTETRVIIILVLVLVCIAIIVVELLFPFIIDYFIKFSYTSSNKPHPIHYLFYSAGIIAYSLALFGGIYAARNGLTLLKIFFTLFIVATIFTILPSGFLGIPWPPIRYIMYMSIASSILASIGMEKSVELIKKFEKKNIFSKYSLTFFIIGTIIFQSSIGLTALIGKGYWDFAINKSEYQVLTWLNNNANYSESVIVYPSIILPSRALLNPRLVGTNTTHVFNEDVVNSTIIAELLSSRYRYLIVDVNNYPSLTSLLEANSSFTLVYIASNIRVYQF